jgi:hypothetical protein
MVQILTPFSDGVQISTMHARHKTKLQRGLCAVHGCTKPKMKNAGLCRVHWLLARQIKLPRRRVK